MILPVTLMMLLATHFCWMTIPGEREFFFQNKKIDIPDSYSNHALLNAAFLSQLMTFLVLFMRRISQM